MATFLDPKFKHYALTKSLGDQTKTKVINAVAQHIRNNTNNTETLPAVPVEERDECCIWDNFDSKTSAITSQGTNTSKAIIEVNRYIDDNILPRTNDSFSWWRDNSYNYPNLSKIVKEKCCVVGSSVPCERVFSKAGFVISERRNRLKPNKVKQILFLNHNYRLFEM